jgi:hypothetical protein
MIESHHIPEERETLLDFAKREYAKQQELSIFKNVPLKSQTVHDTSASNQIPLLSIGWAMRKERQSNRIAPDVIAWLNELFEDGENTGRKINSPTAAQQMRSITANGKKHFNREKWLNKDQISAYFSRYTAKRKRTNATCCTASKVYDSEEIDGNEDVDETYSIDNNESQHDFDAQYEDEAYAELEMEAKNCARSLTYYSC